MKKNVIVRSNREYDYFGNVLEYKYDYFASYSSTSTQKVLVLEYEYKYTSTITPSLQLVFLYYAVGHGGQSTGLTRRRRNGSVRDSRSNQLDFLNIKFFK